MTRIKNRNTTPLLPLVLDMGMGIPGGYTDTGTPGTGTDSLFCTQSVPVTHIRQTRTHSGGFLLRCR
jgi:hypothetical protein